MSSGLPATVDPIRLADARAHISGELPVKAMGRLRTMCLDDEGEASISLHFERSGEQSLRRMRGTITVSLHVACQRCLERMTLVVKTEPSLILVKSGDRSERLTQETDVLVSDKPLSLTNIVEEELLLAMPMIPMHDIGDCPVKLYVTAPEAEVQSSRGNPFAVLSRLKRKDK